jgi:3-oxoacyl-[acyl-carrier protein] reductase
MSTQRARIQALVTGASRGIGKAIAIQLASRGCRVAIHCHTNRSAAEAVVEELPGNGHVVLTADLGRRADAEALWREAIGAFETIDVLVNNAGIYSEHSPLQTAPDAWQAAWDETLATNLIGPAILSHAAANAMATRKDKVRWPDFGRGRIVNISSRGAFRGEPDAPAYGASKAGLNSLSQSLAKALAPRAVYVFCLAPGWVETDMAAEFLSGPAESDILAQHPLGRVTSPDEVARAATFCALDAPPAMTGAILDVNGASYLRT